MARRRYYSDNSELDILESFYGLEHTVDEETGEWSVHSSDGTSHAELVNRYNEKMNRLNAVAEVYQRANRIITGEDITVEVVSDSTMETSARSNGVDIQLNALHIEDLTDESIISLHGLNYHELAHIMFSPRVGSDLGKYIKDNKLFHACSIAEEGRAEQLLTLKYPAVRLFLEGSLYTYLLAKPSSEWGEVFYLVTQRTYLPLELRQMVTNKGIEMYGIDIVKELHSILHAYRTLSFPTDFDKAKELLQRLAQIVGYDDNPKGGIGEGDTFGKSPCGLPTKGRPASKKEQESIQERDNSTTEKVDGSPSQSPQQTNEQLDKEITDEDIANAQALTERLEQIKNNSTVKREIRDTRNAITDSDFAKADISEGTFHEMTPSIGAISMSKRFGTELERLVRNNDPAWVSRVRSGRLNVQRTMNPDVNAISEMFDQWDIGNEATDIEAVILTDNSGSMAGYMNSVCENTWVVKRGIESINGKVTVFSFDSETEILYNAEDKAKPQTFRFVNSRGSTNPIRGIIEANRILTASKKPIKLLFIITDGEWDKDEQCNLLIKDMNNKGFLTCVVFIGEVSSYKDLIKRSVEGEEYATKYIKKLRHNAKLFYAVSTPRDILNVATELVKSTLKKVS